jgi:hypothetical protein
MKLGDDMPLDHEVTKPGKSQHTPMMQHYRCVTFFCSAFPSIQSRAI